MTNSISGRMKWLWLVSLFWFGFCSQSLFADSIGQADKIWRDLPKASFTWKALWTSSLKTPEEIERMADQAREMGFNVVIGMYDPVMAKAVHERGMKYYVWIVNLCSGGRGRLISTGFAKSHPEYLQKVKPEEEVMIKQPRKNPDRANVHGGIWLCPDRGLLPVEKKAIEDIARKKDVDGFGLDYVGYRNYYACFCDYSNEQRQRYAKAHPGLSEDEIMRKYSEECLVRYIRQIRNAVKSIRPDMKIAIHIYPDFDPSPCYANKLDVDYCGETVAWFYQPFWSYDKIASLTRRYAEAEGKFHAFNHFVPFIGVYSGERLKSPERLRNEIRIAGSSGTGNIMLAFYRTFDKHPELAKVVAEELKR